jgi:hypothetical protein
MPEPITRDQYVEYIAESTLDLFKKVCTEPDGVVVKCKSDRTPILVTVSMSDEDADVDDPSDVFLAAQKIIARIGDINDYETELKREKG